MTGVERCFKYCEDVEQGKIVTNQYIKLTVKRFRNDLKRAEKKDCPFYFDEKKAEKFIKFTECLKQYKDEFRGKPLILENWQCFIFANLYGFVLKDNPNIRRFNKGFVFVGRKNGKSTMMASTLLYDILTTAGAEGYCAATKREQSRIVLDVVRQMVKQNVGLSSRLTYYNSTSRIINERLAGKIEALSADSDSMDGLNPSCVVVDEVSAMKNFNIIKVLQSGQGSRPSPLLFEITSGSDDMYSAGRLEFERSAKILEGSIEDDSFFCVLYCLDPKDNWKDPKNDIKANPNLNISIKQSFLDKARKEAIQQPALEGEFRTKNLGQWVSPINVWIPHQTWNKSVKNGNEIPFPEEKVNQAVIVGAVDLSERYDFTVYTLYFYFPSLEKFFARHKMYFPEEQIEAKMQRDSPMIRKWIEQGYITPTPGSVVNYTYMFNDIKKDIDNYNVLEIAYDPYNSTSLITELQEYIDLIEIQQSMKNISPYAKDWEAAIINEEIVDNNPVMKWMVSNAKVLKDTNGNIKPVKDAGSASSSKRIDGVITSLMCHGRIKAHLDEGIDLRTAEEIREDMERKLAEIVY